MNTLRERGDIPKLVKLTGVSRSGLYVILGNGSCTSSVAAKLIKFYEQRKADRAMLKTYIHDND